jgi:hypothetical protein
VWIYYTVYRLIEHNKLIKQRYQYNWSNTCVPNWKKSAEVKYWLSENIVNLLTWQTFIACNLSKVHKLKLFFDKFSSEFLRSIPERLQYSYVFLWSFYLWIFIKKESIFVYERYFPPPNQYTNRVLTWKKCCSIYSIGN